MNIVQHSNRRRRLCYWDNLRAVTDATKLNIERHLSFLPDFDLQHLKTLDDQKFLPCDLLILNAMDVPGNEFAKWLSGIHKRLKSQHGVWTPTLIFSDANFTTLSEEIHSFAMSNWYFDIINPQHLDSVPIRVANLLKIHDHLHELLRYQEQLDKMQLQIEAIEQKLEPS